MLSGCVPVASVSLFFSFMLHMRTQPLNTPESVGDVLHCAIGRDAVEALVGGGALQRAEMAAIGADLDIVEIGYGDSCRYADAPAVPGHMELGILLMHILRQQVDALWVGITTHEGDAGDVAPILGDKIVQRISVKRHSDVPPQILTMTSRAMTRAIADVNGQCHLVGNLLKNNTGVHIFKHGCKDTHFFRFAAHAGCKKSNN